MDRVETYVGQSIYEWYFSKQAQNDMVGLGRLSAALMGTAGMVNGLGCTQTTVASMQVSIGQGELYQLASLEATVCGTLPVNTTDQVLKQGILLGSAAPYNLPASSTFATPGSSGQSINYLIEAQYQDQDVSVDPTTGATPVTLNFYNSSNPSTPWSGPNNTGASSNTFRKGVIAWQVKAGTAATTGTQTTPSPDSGWIGLYVVTVAYGASSITNSNIAVYPGAPFIASGGVIAGGLQGNGFVISTAGGTSDALTGSYSPGITAVTNGMSLLLRAGAANATTTPTFTPNSGVIGAVTIVKGSGTPLNPGDIAGAGHWIELQYDSSLAKWVLLNPATGAAPASSAPVGSVRNLKMSIAAASATATLTADEIIVEAALGGASYKLASFNKTINLATTGAGGMDTGTAPVSGYVAVYAFYNPATGSSALVGYNATSAVAPNIYGGANAPSGYTASALISVWPTNASSQFVAGLQRDRKVSIGGVTVLTSGSNQASYASLSISVAAPKNALAVSGCINVTSTSSTFCTGAVTPDGTSDIQQIAASNVVQILAPFRDLPILTAQTLYYAAFVNAGTPSISVVVSGYTF